jgi:hypothetical protein
MWLSERQIDAMAEKIHAPKFAYGTPETPSQFSRRIDIDPHRFKLAWKEPGRPEVRVRIGPSGRIVKVVATPEFDRFMITASKTCRQTTEWRNL